MKRKILTLLLILLSFVYVQQAIMAQNDTSATAPEASVQSDQLSDAQYNEIQKNKRAMTENDIEKKNENGYITGLPLINSDPVNGIGYGARVYYFDNGQKSDRLFKFTPYRQRLYAQFFQTTNGFQYHTLDYDAPYIFGTLFRLTANVVYEKNTNANFFGTGDETLKGLKDPTGKEFQKFKDYNDELQKIDSAGRTNARYNKFIYEAPGAYLALQRDLAYVLGGVIRPIAGVQIKKFSISDYSGKSIDVDGKKAIQNNTLLKRYNNVGLAPGYNGGWDNRIFVGVAFDGRDFEPDPNNGYLTEVIIESANKAIGSNYDYTRTTLSQKVYYSPFEETIDLVFAGKYTAVFLDGDAPFYARNKISYTSGLKTGLGGLRTLRGYKTDRFTGKVFSVLNLEVRYTFFDFKAAGQTFALILVPFIDAGRVYNDPKKMGLTGYRYNYGAGFRIAWNQATIIMIDYGMSSEDSNLFINFEHIF